MDIRSDFDWRHVGLFVAVAEHGSLSAAARVLRVSQPTIGRAIQALEEELGVSLFSRHPRGLKLTEQGEELALHGREMAQAAAKFSLAAAGRSDDLVGTVRITASQVVATFVLPAILARLRREEPRIQVEIVATDEVESLLYREADIAIRMVRPKQQELIARHVADMPMGIYASHAYLAAQTAPITADTLDLFSLIGYDRSTLIIDAARELGVHFTRGSFSYRCDDQVACWHMVLAGAGIGFTSNWVAQGDERVVKILPEIKLGFLPVWLTSHSALKTNPRVRFVFDFLVKVLGKM